jgi:hypothetical protein
LKTYKVLLVLLLFLFVNQSCKKKSLIEDEEKQQLEMIAEMEQFFAFTDRFLIFIANYAEHMPEGEFELSYNTCSKVKAKFIGAKAVYPRKIEVRFIGDECITNSIKASGLLTINLSRPLLQTGSRISMQTNKWMCNNFIFSGERRALNIGLNNKSEPEFAFSESGWNLFYPFYDIKDNTLSRQTTLVWKEGFTDNALQSNTFEVNGISAFVNKSGQETSIQVWNNLVYVPECPYVDIGTLSVQFYNSRKFLIEFGSTTACKNAYTYDFQ